MTIAPETQGPIIDMHTHVLEEETMRLLQREAPSIAPRLSAVDAEGGVLEVAGIVQKPFPRAAWDLERRFSDMAAYGVDMQLVCNIPHTFLYEQEPALALACAQLQNEQIAGLNARHPDRFLGLASVPLQSPVQAAGEMARAMRTLGLRGLHIGSNVAGRNLDDPALEPVWAVANEMSAFVLVHPHKITAGDRLKSYYLKNLIGNPLETTIAAACLVFGGVVERFPHIRFCLSHGGGFTPYQAGRFRHGWAVREEAKAHLQGDPDASLSRLLYDSILHSVEGLDALVGLVGPDRVLLGSDYPFDMGSLDCVRQVRALDRPGVERDRILRGGLDLLAPLGGADASTQRRAS
jgi:aminocarboxymuconate-semialdehyde decarboxylase